MARPLDKTLERQLDSVPMLDLHRQYEQVQAEVLAAVERVCASQHYILGPEVEALERELAAFCGARDAVGCASGTDALWLALAAVGVQAGDQVLTTPFSFFASASAIVRAGGRPVFADIDPLTFNLDPGRVHRDDDVGNALVLGGLGFRAHQAEHHLGQVSGARPDFRAGNYEVFSVL